MCHARACRSCLHGRGRSSADHLPFLQVRVGHDALVGEVIRIEADKATIQVYEETGLALVSCIRGWTKMIDSFLQRV